MTEKDAAEVAVTLFSNVARVSKIEGEIWGAYDVSGALIAEIKSGRFNWIEVDYLNERNEITTEMVYRDVSRGILSVGKEILN